MHLITCVHCSRRNGCISVCPARCQASLAKPLLGGAEAAHRRRQLLPAQLRQRPHAVNFRGPQRPGREACGAQRRACHLQQAVGKCIMMWPPSAEALACCRLPPLLPHGHKPGLLWPHLPAQSRALLLPAALPRPAASGARALGLLSPHLSLQLSSRPEHHCGLLPPQLLLPATATARRPPPAAPL